MLLKINSKFYIAPLLLCIIALHKTSQAQEKKQNTAQKKEYFENIRKKYSYDPETKKWSIIQEFDTIEIITEKKNDTTHLSDLDDDDKILYENFWMYDIQKNQWFKKDIPTYGYLNQEKIIQNLKKKVFNFDKISLDFSIGPGITFYNNKIQECTLIQRKDENIFYIQTKNKTIYQLDWFETILKKIKKNKITGVTEKIQNPIFKAIGFSLPIDIIVDYNIYRKIRLGGGIKGTVNYLKKLKLIPNEKKFTAYTTTGKQYFLDIKYFGLLGYKFMHNAKYNWIINTKIGLSQDLGSIPKRIWKNIFIRQTKYFDIGIKFEKKILKKNKIFTRLAFEWKEYTDEQEYFKIFLQQPALYLEMGIGTNFNT